ncbi:MAG TPA: hypothetical protein VGY57_10880 [Vicinamibacterales bacterium]|nr:hypothetical protein [Vicinamibacterales bacterium]
MTTVLLAGLLAGSGNGTARLTTRVVRIAPLVAAPPIVGRAACAGSTWLLTTSGTLIRIARHGERVVTRQVGQLRDDDRLWGLACLDDGSLWTLAAGHVLARLTSDGAIAERRALLLPQVELFGIRDRLVFLGLPIVPNRPVLAASTRREPQNVRPWTGLIGRAGFGTSPDLVTNLVGCGIGFGSMLPCWFSDQNRISISDGTLTRTIAFPLLERDGIDRVAPIRDVALVEGGAMWILAASTTTSNGRRVGGRLIKANAAGVEQSSLALAPAARVIVDSSAHRCVLLAVTGMLIEVSDEPEAIL